MSPTLAELRRYAIARSLFAPTTLMRAINKLGFVQADPIRSPARAQDLTLRHRVRDYRAGDLERRYPRLPVEEDFFVNYGFVPRALQAHMHPRKVQGWSAARAREAAELLAYIAERGAVHPRSVAAHFARGRVRNWFGGNTHATTALLDEMHYRGMLRVARRDGGTRVYAVRADATEPALSPGARLDALIDVVVAKYAPLPAATLSQLIYRLRYAAPQWEGERAAALARARSLLAGARLEGVSWYWPVGESPRARRWQLDEQVRLLAPFDPIVWDRRRFTAFFGWSYRFEAYTPAAKRVRGYYALPLLWQDRMVGWGNLKMSGGELRSSFGFIERAVRRDPLFQRALEAEVERMRQFLADDLPAPPPAP
jgi:uncharacterized protein YcaQ